MTTPFDATLKELLEDSPESWPAFVGRPGGPVAVVDSDIGTVTGAADKVLRVGGPPAWLLHVEAQAGPDATLPQRAHVYNVLLSHRHGLPVQTVVLLLRRQANLTAIDGEHEVGLPELEPFLRFRYRVVRVWEEPPETFLAGGAGTAPLALVSAVRRSALPAVFERVRQQLHTAGDVGRERRLWSAAYVLMGLRYPVGLIDQFFAGIQTMEESVTYQAIIARGKEKGRLEGLQEGRLLETRSNVLLLGKALLGEPSPRVLAALEAETSLENLQQLLLRVARAASWDELFPPPTRRKKRGS